MSPCTVVSVGDTPSGVVAGLARFSHEVHVVRQCPALDELLAACQSGLAQVALVAEFGQELTATLIDRLTAVGVSVVAVASTAEEATRLKGIGAHAVSSHIGSQELVAVVRAAVEGRRHPGSTGFAVPASASSLMDDAGTRPAAATGASAGGGGGDGKQRGKNARRKQTGAGARKPGGQASPGGSAMSGSTVSKSGAGAAATSEAGAGRERTLGTLVALWGPIGSPGRTTLAINLAAEQAAAGMKVMVIDADSYGASIGASLGLLEESASFAQACRSADQGNLTTARLAATSTRVVFKGGTFLLLTGLTRSDRWPELRASAVERVLQLARETMDLVVVDCGFALENDEELSYDTVAPRRNAATLKVLAKADIVFAVGSGDPLGIPRLIRGMDQLATHSLAAEVRVVVNKVRRKAVGGTAEKSLLQAWERFGPGPAISHFLPWDHELTDRALLEGRLLLELEPEAALRRAIRDISCADDQRKTKLL